MRREEWALRQVVLQKRNQDIATKYAAGLATMRELAYEYGVGERQIRKIIRRERTRAAQAYSS